MSLNVFELIEHRLAGMGVYVSVISYFGDKFKIGLPLNLDYRKIDSGLIEIPNRSIMRPRGRLRQFFRLNLFA